MSDVNSILREAVSYRLEEGQERVSRIQILRDIHQTYPEASEAISSWPQDGDEYLNSFFHIDCCPRCSERHSYRSRASDSKSTTALCDTCIADVLEGAVKVEREDQSAILDEGQILEAMNRVCPKSVEAWPPWLELDSAMRKASVEDALPCYSCFKTLYILDASRLPALCAPCQDEERSRQAEGSIVQLQKERYKSTLLRATEALLKDTGAVQSMEITKLLSSQHSEIASYYADGHKEIETCLTDHGYSKIPCGSCGESQFATKAREKWIMKMCEPCLTINCAKTLLELFSKQELVTNSVFTRKMNEKYSQLIKVFPSAKIEDLVAKDLIRYKLGSGGGKRYSRGSKLANYEE